MENKHKKPDHAKNAAYWFEQCAIENEKRGILEFEMQELDKTILELRKSLAACVDALDQEALATDWFKLPLYRCGAWYQIRAEAHRLLNL